MATSAYVLRGAGPGHIIWAVTMLIAVNEERLGRRMASVHPCPASHTGEQLPGAQLILTSAHVQYLNSDFALCDYCMHGTRAAINSVLKPPFST